MSYLSYLWHLSLDDERKALSSQSKGDSLRNERRFIGKVKAIHEFLQNNVKQVIRLRSSKISFIFLCGMARMTLGSSCYFYTHFGAANSILISKIFSNTTKIVFIKRKSFLSTIKSISQTLGYTFHALGYTFQALGYTSQTLGHNFHHRERTYSPLSKNNISVV